MDFEEFKKTRYFKILIYLLSFLVFVLLMDNVVMPWYVNLGEEIEMPDIVEMNVNEAKNLLDQQGFNVIVADSVFDAFYSEGMVVEQLPLANSTVKVGRNVYLTVSIGEKPIVMPNLFGISSREAELRLNAMGLKLKTVYYSWTNLYPEEAVIAQSFPSGQRVNKNTEITITVSLGEKPSEQKMPNLVGKSLSSAREQLKQFGVSIRDIEYEKNSSYLPQTVLKQSLSAGNLIAEGTEVDLTVSKIEDREE